MPFGVETDNVASGTVIMIKKNNPDNSVGVGYVVEIYNGGIKTDILPKKTKKDALEVVKEYKNMYGTNRAFENQVEVFVTYPQKDHIYEQNKNESDKENTKKESRSITMNTEHLYKKAEKIEDLLNKFFSPEKPIKIREAADSLMQDAQIDPTFSDEGDYSEGSISEEILSKLKSFFTDYASSSDVSDTSIGYNKIKPWLFKLQDILKKYNIQTTTASKSEGISKTASSSINGDTLVQELTRLINEDEEFPDIGKNILSMKPGNIEGGNQFSEESEESELRAAGLQKDFFKYAASLKGTFTLEDVFNNFLSENKIADLNTADNLWQSINKLF